MKRLGHWASGALVLGLLLSGCGGKEPAPREEKRAEHKPKKEKVRPAPKPGKKPKIVLPPLESPDCTAKVAPAAFAPAKLTEADGFREPATEGPANLAAGPILGAVAADEATVWIAADRAAPWRVTYWPAKQAKKKVVVEGPVPTKESDFTATVRLDKLAASTAYEYEVEVGAAGAGTKLPAKPFRTLAAKGTPGKLRIAVGSRLPADPAQPILGEIAATDPDLLLLIGDQIYAGELKATPIAYADKYRHNWNVPQLKELMQTVPTFMMWDDQDIKNGYFEGSSPKRYPPARLAYELYAQAHNPSPVREGELHYEFQAGDVSFFVLDVRSHRTDPDDDDGAHKSMIGPEQKADLARFLKCAPGAIKVVVTPAPVSNLVFVKKAWPEYDAERKQLIGFIAREKVDDVIMLSAEASWSAVLFHDHKETRFYELMTGPLSKELGKAPGNDAKGIVARDDDHHAFGVVDIDTKAKPATIAFTLCVQGKPCKPGEEKAPASGLDKQGAEETAPFTVKITTDDIGPTPAEEKKLEPAEKKPAEKKPAETK